MARAYRSVEISLARDGVYADVDVEVHFHAIESRLEDADVRLEAADDDGLSFSEKTVDLRIAAHRELGLRIHRRLLHGQLFHRTFQLFGILLCRLSLATTNDLTSHT